MGVAGKLATLTRITGQNKIKSTIIVILFFFLPILILPLLKITISYQSFQRICLWNDLPGICITNRNFLCKPLWKLVFPIYSSHSTAMLMPCDLDFHHDKSKLPFPFTYMYSMETSCFHWKVKCYGGKFSNRYTYINPRNLYIKLLAQETQTVHICSLIQSAAKPGGFAATTGRKRFFLGRSMYRWCHNHHTLG